jgi:hypothetical protein
MPDEETVTWVEWRPTYATHVLGKYTSPRRDPETMEQLEQVYVIECEKCSQRWGPLKCTTGAVRNHIATFAIAHLHRSPLDPVKR